MEAVNSVRVIEQQLKDSPKLMELLGSQKASIMQFVTKPTVKTLGALMGINPEKYFNEEERTLWMNTEKMFQNSEK
jgi:hypothetical protein